MSVSQLYPENDPIQNRREAKIYYYGGHGNDICDQRTRVPIVRLVPENCIYITIAECGFKTKLHGPEEDFFQNELSRYLLRYPNVGDNKEEIAAKLMRNRDWLHIHMPGTPYVVSTLHPFGYWYSPQETGIALSGLCEKAKMEKLEQRAKAIITTPPYIHGFLTGQEILDLLATYDKSLFKKQKAIDLMLDIAGPNYLRYRFNKYKATDILRDINIVITKTKFLNYYEASVYPTKEQVQGYLEDLFPNRTLLFASDFPVFGEYLEEMMNPDGKADSDKEFPLSNTYLMENFPGIHYNVVCREVGPNCYPTFQRTLSGVQEATREGKEIELRPTKTFEQLKERIENMMSRPHLSFKQRSIDIKRFLAFEAVNLYLLSQEQKQQLFDLLVDQGYIKKNTEAATKDSNVMKYYLMPEKYRVEVGGTRRRKKAKRSKTRK